jgi:transcriptional regulator
MYAPPVFRMDEQNDVAAFIAARRFASLVIGGAEPVAAYIPMLLITHPDGRVTLEGHLAKGNPALAAARASGRALAIFHGADAYVSPGFYPSKLEHGKVVPTWNYIAAEAHGPIETFDDAPGLHAQIAALTTMMEASTDAPWSVTDAPADYIDRMINGITGVRLHVERLEGVRKLSQNKAEPDRAGVSAGLAGSTDADARRLASEMETSGGVAR